MVAVHEPFSDLAGLGETDVEGRPFHSPVALLDWLRDQTHDVDVFLKDTPDHRHQELLADRRFLAEARHAFLIRRPEEIAASLYAVEPNITVGSVGLEFLHKLHAAVGDAGDTNRSSSTPTISSHDPSRRWRRTARSSGCPLIPAALTWAPGERHEWRRSACWHLDVSASAGFAPPQRRYIHNVETSDELERFAAHHRPFYEQLCTQRVDLSAGEPVAGT